MTAGVPTTTEPRTPSLPPAVAAVPPVKTRTASASTNGFISMAHRMKLISFRNNLRFILTATIMPQLGAGRGVWRSGPIRVSRAPQADSRVPGNVRIDLSRAPNWRGGARINAASSLTLRRGVCYFPAFREGSPPASFKSRPPVLPSRERTSATDRRREAVRAGPGGLRGRERFRAPGRRRLRAVSRRESPRRGCDVRPLLRRPFDSPGGQAGGDRGAGAAGEAEPGSAQLSPRAGRQPSPGGSRGNPGLLRGDHGRAPGDREGRDDDRRAVVDGRAEAAQGIARENDRTHGEDHAPWRPDRPGRGAHADRIEGVRRDAEAPAGRPARAARRNAVTWGRARGSARRR